MRFREQEYAELNLTVQWLAPELAKQTYQIAMRFSSKHRYGLNKETVSHPAPY